MKNIAPLPDRMRPRSFAEFFGQEHIIGNNTILRRLIENDELSSIIFWGPPGTGKTTLAKIIANQTKSFFVSISAVMSGKQDLKNELEQAKARLKTDGRRTVLFIDEIHRWNKAQQDALLPHVESGFIILIGATTENPSFEIIGALLSRSRVFVLNRLADEDVVKVIKSSIKDKERGLGMLNVNISEEDILFLASLSG
jgi:putative ATPase